MKFLPVANDKKSRQLRKLPTRAVDLGFSEKSESCGLSGFCGSLTFSKAVSETADWLIRQPKSAVLILEAPLSGSFNDAGNPLPRGEFEKTHSENRAIQSRVWHSGAGASMALDALHFLRRLQELTAQNHSNVHLVEGFCSRYSRRAVCNVFVATELLRLRQEEKPLLETEGATKLITLRLLEPLATEIPPAVLRVRDSFPHSAS